MIDFASKEDSQALIALWEQCFGDSRDYIRLFLDALWTKENCLVVRRNGKVSSMLFLLDGTLRCGGIQKQSGYIYAACTAEDQRGKGLMSALLEKAGEVAKHQGKEFLCLVPSEQSLFGYYARFGYMTAFKTKKIVLSRYVLELIADAPQSAQEPSAQEIRDLRSEYLLKEAAFLWGTDVLDYARKETLFSGGQVLYAGKNGRLKAYALTTITKDRTIVKELCVRENGLGALAGLLLEDGSDRYEFQLPVSYPLSADHFSIVEKGMLKPLSNSAKEAAAAIKDAYIGLTLE